MPLSRHNRILISVIASEGAYYYEATFIERLQDDDHFLTHSMILMLKLGVSALKCTAG
jgi:hypothetical protein